MPEIVSDPPLPSCYRLFPAPGIQVSQQLGPDPFLPRARDARGRFAKGSSGNPRGRPRGIPNPKRRVPDRAARPLSPQALSDLIDRKPHLLRPLAAQLLPPLAPIDPAKRLGIDLSALRTAEEFRRVLASVLTAIARGEITPAEGVDIAKRVDARLRGGRRLAWLMRRAATQTSSVRAALDRMPSSARLFGGAAAMGEALLLAGDELEQCGTPVFRLAAGAEDRVADLCRIFDPLAPPPEIARDVGVIAAEVARPVAFVRQRHRVGLDRHRRVVQH